MKTAVKTTLMLMGLFLLLILPAQQVSALPPTWQAMGPYLVRWVETAPSNPSILYALERAFGFDDQANPVYTLITSPDGGQHWSLLITGLKADTELSIDPTNPARLFRWTEIGGLYQSIDGGLVWSANLKPDTPSRIMTVAVDPLAPQTVYLGTYDYLYKSTNGGQSFDKIAFPGYTAYQIQFVGSDPEILVIRNWNVSVFTSSDGGAHWNEGTGLPYGHSDLGLFIDPTSPLDFYIANTDPEPDELYHSSDGGLTFVPLNAPIPVGFDPLAHGTYYALDGGVLSRTTDDGGTFKDITPGLPAAMAYDPPVVNTNQPARLYLTTPLGLYQSNDRGDTWSMLATQYGYGFVMGLTRSAGSQGALYAALVRPPSGGFPALLKQTALAPWTLQSNAPCANPVATNPIEPNVLYLGCEGKGVWKSADGGDSWDVLGTGMTNPNILALALADQGQTIYAGARYYFAPDGINNIEGGVFASHNGGQTWTISRAGTSNPSVYALAVDPQNSDIVYAAIHSNVGEGIIKSVDGGDNWSFNITGLTSRDVRALVVSPADSQVVLAATYGGGVFKSIDGGITWAPANAGMPTGAKYAYAFSIHPLMPQTVFAAMGDGIYRSKNSGITWAKVGAWLPTGTTSVLVDPLDPSVVYAGSYGNGVFTLRLPDAFSIYLPALIN